ncbi:MULTISPECIES: S8 family peptidase [unclassified Sphingobacterium]|uniref:S8 family peptidase n=1 Tax=unclassified Sphingobacterium TaxID=2609468 RepID=UPI0025D180EA|nr:MULTISPECIES: S8 family peptidase [unclassified Sphingobacterium]
MSQFPHLTFKDSFKGDFRFKTGYRKPNPKTIENRRNSRSHGIFIGNNANSVKERYKNELARRAQEGLPHLDENMIPVFLQVDPDGFDIEALKGFGIEIISEEEEGFIIGASIDGFSSLERKIKQFIEEDKAVNTAQLWDIVLGENWRVEQILSEELQRRWSQIEDEDILVVDVSIACYLKAPDYPLRDKEDSDEKYEQRIERWRDRYQKYEIEKDDFEFARHEDVQRFLENYGAEIISGFISERDSFSFSVRLRGKILKDFVFNYPYVFEVIEKAVIDSPVGFEGDGEEWDMDILPPSIDAPKVCVIDSGVMEGHKLLLPAILSKESMSFVPNSAHTVADEVVNGGHGTRVAGAVLFGNNIPREGKYQAPCYIYNARVLDGDNQLSSLLFPPELMENVCLNFGDAHIFNLSINNRVACRTTHMSQWAASLDRMSHEDAHLFVVSAGNLSTEKVQPNNPGIKDHRSAGRNYPVYLLENASRVADPAQSLFSITVGSICIDHYEDEDLKSFGQRDHVSSFSRSGLGIWNSIKPELVEYGGDWVTEKMGNNLIIKETTCPETVVSRGLGVARDTVGTSFAAPKVSHILAKLVAQFPFEGALFHKALLLQSARLPEHVRHNPDLNAMRHYGYGIPDSVRAVENSARRITFTTSDGVSPGQANLYTVQIPDELRRQGQDFDILIEVSLCYTAKSRRTRRRINSYLSSWLSWQSALLGQGIEEFKQEVIKDIENDVDAANDDPFDQPTRISWTIDEHPNWGQVKEIKRQANANQKDWATLKSYNLPTELSFAVVGHKGWEKDLEEKVPFAFVVSFEVLNGEIPLYDLMARVNIEVEQESQIPLF